jgi:cell division protein FtsL
MLEAKMKNETALLILSLICVFLTALSVVIAAKYKNAYLSIGEIQTRLNSLSQHQKGIEYYHENCGRWITDLEKRVDELEK